MNEKINLDAESLTGYNEPTAKTDPPPKPKLEPEWSTPTKEVAAKKRRKNQP